MNVKQKNEIAKTNVLVSLQNLAQILDIPLKQGWKSSIAKFFDVPPSQVSQWLRRGNIPEEKRKRAVKKGYGLDSWLQEEKDHRILEPELSGGHQNGTPDEEKLQGSGGESRLTALSVPLDLQKIFDQYPELKYVLMFAQDGKRRELEQMILNWAGDIKKRKTPTEGERRAAE